MPDGPVPPQWHPYATAVVSSILAIAAVALFARMPPHEHTLMPLIIAVVVSAWHGGSRPGLVAAVLTTASAAFLFLNPVWSVRTGSGAEQLRLAMLAGISVAISFICESLHRYRRRAETVAAALQEKQTALQDQIERYRRSEGIYRAIGESIDYGVWICEPGGQNVYASESFLELVGIAQEQCSAYGWGTVLHPDDAEETIRAWQECVRTGTFWEREHRFRGVDGEWHYVLARGVPIRDEDGRILCWAGINLDIGALKRAQADLAEERERLRLAIGSARLVAWDMDMASGVVTCSETARDLWGIERANAAEFFARVHPEDREKVERAAAPASDADQQYSLEYRVIAPDGQVRWLHSRGEFKFGPDGRPLRLSGMSMDVTPLKEAEERLREADKRKDDFLATLSHELRNPLAPLRTALHVLRSRSADPQVAASALEVMDRQLRHLVRLVDDLLDMSRISTGRIGLQRAPTPIDQIVASAVETSTPVIQAAGHRLTVETATPAPWVHADQTRIAQALANLLNNAAKYTPAGGTIMLSTGQTDGHVVIRCRDTGIGFDPAVLPHIFDPFRSASAHDSGGLGIGLSVARRLVELHGGTLDARSDGPGTGAEFTIRLPAIAAATPASEKTETAMSTTPRRRVLIIDDNRDSAEMLETLLSVIGHEPRLAFTGTSGIDAALKEKPDVILLDIGLPDLNGYDVARRLRAEPSLVGVTLIALTGWGQPEDRVRAKEAGFDHHLTKPADPDALAALLASRA